VSSTTEAATHHPHAHGFRHEALFYAGEQGFLDGTVPFLREGVDAGEPVLVVVAAPKIERLRGALGPAADGVMFADMREVGANPARIIPAWRDFLDTSAERGRPVRGIGEPIDAERGPAELEECHRHELLLNLAFDDSEGFRLLCPYDTGSLDPEVVAEARRTHPILVEQPGAERPSDAYAGLETATARWEDPLPPPTPPVERLAFGSSTLPLVRRVVDRHARTLGLDRERAADLLLAVTELAANSVRHGGGDGELLVWHEPGALLCEVTDRGRFDRPLAGRERPKAGQIGGYGLWLVNQVCDLVQVRSTPAGTVARLHTRV
jgi:anti-sigma regulatory factor (Ser/Thr protein kinase)